MNLTHHGHTYVSVFTIENPLDRTGPNLLQSMFDELMVRMQSTDQTSYFASSFHSSFSSFLFFFSWGGVGEVW